MSNKKQSSIDWFDRWFRDNPEATHEEGNAALQQAKAMHNKEIVDAHVNGNKEYTIGGGYELIAEHYYNKTFGGQDNE